MNKNKFISRSSPLYKDGTIVLLKTSTDTLKLLNPNADALMLGDATHEGGDIKVYRDGSGNLALSFDADAASNAMGLSLFAGVVCQNNVTIGQTSLNTSYPLFVSGVGYISSGVKTEGDFYAAAEKGLIGKLDNQSSLRTNINVSGTDSSNHSFHIQIDGNDIITAQATGNGAGSTINPAIGLYPGTTPTVQAGHIADPAESTAGNNAAIDAILVALENIGILASS